MRDRLTGKMFYIDTVWNNFYRPLKTHAPRPIGEISGERLNNIRFCKSPAEQWPQRPHGAFDLRERIAFLEIQQIFHFRMDRLKNTRRNTRGVSHECPDSVVVIFFVKLRSFMD